MMRGARARLDRDGASPAPTDTSSLMAPLRAALTAVLRATAMLAAITAVLLVAPGGALADPPPAAPSASASAAPIADSPGARVIAAGEEAASGSTVPEIGEVPDRALAGKPIRRVEVVIAGGRWTAAPAIASVRPGEPLGPEAGRRAMRELLASGRFARANVEAYAEGDGAVLRIHALPRRLIARVQLTGGALDTADTLEAAEIADGGEITAPGLSQIGARIHRYYERHGFPSAEAAADTSDTDDPDRVVLSIKVTPGAPRTVTQRVFVIEPAADREVGDLKTKYRLGRGARLDETALDEADRDLGEVLKQKGFYRADVKHAIRTAGALGYLYVYVDPGPRIVPIFEGNRAFDGDQLTDALSLEKSPDGRVSELGERVKTFYVTRGFFDVEVSAEERGAAGDAVHYLTFTIREHRQMRVGKRVFPCLAAQVSPDDVGGEIDSFLGEELPGSETFSPVDPRAVARLFGPTSGSGGRGVPAELAPLVTYAPETYDRALKHLRDLYHSKGYMNAVVGPISVLRATCGRASTADRCVPVPPPAPLKARCLKDSLGLPLPEPPVPESYTCKPDPARHVDCAAEVTLWIPLSLGPQTVLYDLAFEGNRSLSERDLGKIADLSLGDPLSNVDLESARARVLDAYRLRGFAYADVRVSLEPTPDRTRARARFYVTEHEQVIVAGFVVKGNKRTEKSIVLRRMRLLQNGPYRQDLLRQSEERLAALGVFSSVSVSLEDPDVPQRRKRVTITVVEQVGQYLEPRVGFSTGEGVRFGFEYGNRNIGGLAISFVLRVQLGYVFDFLITDPVVRQNFGIDQAPRQACTQNSDCISNSCDTLLTHLCRSVPALAAQNRLERRNNITFTFPEIGLSPAVSLSLDAIDVRHNQRDFGLTKDAFVPALAYRPIRQIATQVSLSAERNDVQIFNREAQLSSIVRAPEGTTIALAQRANFIWDFRDNPFNATRGALVSTSVEHVNAFPASGGSDNPAQVRSHFLKLTGRVSAYLRLPKKLVLAVSLAGGYNVQLNSTSKTYPDRLFFLGGVDSIRAFLADALVPQDLADKITDGDPAKCVTGQTPAPGSICAVAVRGGDVMVNPRLELRVPLTDSFQTGVFLDTGNVWTEAANVNLLVLRYALGAGLRITTPIGPLALDYGFNMNRRQWEDIGAFHFSIGLF
jgi:outer membrane protein insertion porin family